MPQPMSLESCESFRIVVQEDDGNPPISGIELAYFLVLFQVAYRAGKRMGVVPPVDDDSGTWENREGLLELDSHKSTLRESGQQFFRMHNYYAFPFTVRSPAFRDICNEANISFSKIIRESPLTFFGLTLNVAIHGLGWAVMFSGGGLKIKVEADGKKNIEFSVPPLATGIQELLKLFLGVDFWPSEQKRRSNEPEPSDEPDEPSNGPGAS